MQDIQSNSGIKLLIKHQAINRILLGWIVPRKYKVISKWHKWFDGIKQVVWRQIMGVKTKQTYQYPTYLLIYSQDRTFE
jgi:hypothetical protein